MLIFAVHRSLAIFTMVILGIFAITGLSRDLQSADEIQSFFTESPACDRVPCFLGIVPKSTEQQGVYRALNDAPYVSGFRTFRVEFGPSRMFIEWDGTQPDFIREEGLITLVGEQADTVELDPELVLGDMLVTLGEPTGTLLSSVNVYLYYFDAGIVLETQVNCEAIWYSPVRVIYRQQILSESTMSQNENIITDACR